MRILFLAAAPCLLDATPARADLTTVQKVVRNGPRAAPVARCEDGETLTIILDPVSTEPGAGPDSPGSPDRPPSRRTELIPPAAASGSRQATL